MVIFDTISPILIVALTGYVAARSKVLGEAECDAITRFVFLFLIPCLLFSATAKSRLPDNLGWEYLVAYYVSAISVFLIGVTLGKYFFGYSAKEQGVYGVGASFSNATIVGVPVCVHGLGEQALLPLFIIVSIHSLILFTIGVVVAECDSLSFSSFFRSFGRICMHLITSPITASLILGGAFNALNIPIYDPLEAGIGILKQAAIPAALFVLGTSLNKYRINGHVIPAIVMASLKCLLLPALVWLFVFRVFDVDLLWASTAVLVSAMPCGVSSYIFSKRYEACEATVAAGIVISTIGSIVTLSLALSFLKSTG